MKITYVTTDDTDMVEVSPGVRILSHVVAIAEDYNGFDVRVTVQFRDGRLCATDVEVSQRPGGPPVTGEALRSVTVASFVRQSIKANLRPGMGGDEPTVGMGQFTLSERDRLVAQGPVEETLAAVARMYSLALAIGDKPTKAVEETFELPRYTAGRWIASARRLGLLGPAAGPGKAGA